MTNKRIIGDIIRTCRKKRGLSQKALADKMLILPSSISAYENGNMQPSAPRLFELMDALDYVIIFRPREKVEARREKEDVSCLTK